MHARVQGPLPTSLLAWCALVAAWLSAVVAPAGAQPASPPVAVRSVPAARAAKNVAVVPIHGLIDQWTVYGVERRLEKAAKDGADAIVFEIDTPGGDVQAMLAICNLIKSSPVQNTVAWVHDEAYSAGSLIALACREIVASSNATMGDALPIQVNQITGQFVSMTDAEREKMLAPLMVEVVDSARRNGYDEMLVQGFIRPGVELWLVEHAATGQRLFVTEDQYRQAVGSEPVRSSPRIPSGTGPLGGAAKGPARDGADPSAPLPAPPASQDPTAYQPAAPNVSPELIGEVNSELSLKALRSSRPDLAAPEHAGMYRPVAYIADGHGLITLKTPEMLAYGVAAAPIDTDAELQSFFGASNVARLQATWSEGLVRFLTNPVVRGVLIVIFLLAVFIEMTHPGVALPAGIAALALIALIIPPVLVDLAAWWMVAAILVGILCLAVELFLLPGFGVFGVAGVLLLFVGLVGVFVGGPSGLFPDSPKERSDLVYGVTTLLISSVTAGVLMFFLGRHLPNLPVLNRVVLKGDGSEQAGSLLDAMAPVEGPLKPGMVGVALTPLRPAGRVQFGDRVHDVVSDLGFIGSGVRVRVVSMDAFRTAVEPVPGEPPGSAPPGAGSGGSGGGAGA